jgi:hypothetical protein
MRVRQLPAPRRSRPYPTLNARHPIPKPLASRASSSLLRRS